MNPQIETGFSTLTNRRAQRPLCIVALNDRHLKRLPSEYIRENVYVTTQPIEEPSKPRFFHQLLEQFGDLTDHLLFASDYPHWDADDPDEAFPVAISLELQKKIYSENARALYRLP